MGIFKFSIEKCVCMSRGLGLKQRKIALPPKIVHLKNKPTFATVYVRACCSQLKLYQRSDQIIKAFRNLKVFLFLTQ